MTHLNIQSFVNTVKDSISLTSLADGLSFMEHLFTPTTQSYILVSAENSGKSTVDIPATPGVLDPVKWCLIIQRRAIDYRFKTLGIVTSIQFKETPLRIVKNTVEQPETAWPELVETLLTGLSRISETSCDVYIKERH